MDQLKSFSSNAILIFEGNNYALCSNRMETYLFYLGLDVYLFIVNGYKYPKTPPIDLDEKKLCSCNYKARKNILNALSPTLQTKVICLILAK